jgi:NAD(P)-dependent dehydrogenase (short-subunit alcohol dehydrogenase family)
MSSFDLRLDDRGKSAGRRGKRRVSLGFWEQRMNLDGKVAAVIGGGDGIGAAITLGLAAAGVDVAVCDHDGPALDSTRRLVEGMGRRTVAETLDALDQARLTAWYDRVAEEFERLDIVVNVVGGVVQRPFAASSPADWDGDIARNFGYALHSIQRALPLIRRGGRGGSIISLTTIEAHRGAAGFAVYAGAKAALTNFTRALAVELAEDQIRVNTLAPDTTPSRGNAAALPAERVAAMTAEPELAAAGLRMYVPMGAAPSPEDIANGVLFLASDLARCVTGTTLHVDGGTFAASGFVNWPLGGGYLPVAGLDMLRRVFRDDDLP